MENTYTICINCGSGIPNIIRDICPFCGLSVTKKSNIIQNIISNTKNELFGYPIETTIEWCASSDDIKYMLVPRTCEYCKHYGKQMTDCDNEKVNKLVDFLSINKDFGCIFWEGK
jgi:hypothetical protein